VDYAVVVEITQWKDYRITLMVGEAEVSTRVDRGTLLMVTGIVAQGLMRQMNSEFSVKMPSLEVIKQDILTEVGRLQ
jgi:hypothetical protein